MTQTINSHNRKVKQTKIEESLSCNCRQKNDCPMDSKCSKMNTVYKWIASVPTKPEKTYTRLSQDEWKSVIITIENCSKTNVINWKQCYPVMCGK